MYCISKPPCEISLSISIFFSKTNKYNRCSHCTCFYVSDGLCVINKCRICGMISVDMQYFPDSENMFFFVLKLYIFVSFFRRKLRIIFPVYFLHAVYFLVSKNNIICSKQIGFKYIIELLDSENQCDIPFNWRCKSRKPRLIISIFAQSRNAQFTEKSFRHYKVG
jgi:hypothetical protein